MHKITGDEFDKMGVHGKGSSSPLYHLLTKLQPGEAVVVMKKEWHVKYPPTRTANKIERTLGYKFDRGALPDRSGWAIKRVK